MPARSQRLHDRPQLLKLGLVLAVISPLLWLGLMAWIEEDLSGWKELATLYPAGDRPLLNSQGTVTVVLKKPGSLPQTLRWRNGRTYIEAGIEDEGFWLRSQRATPQPALFIPWSQVTGCRFTTVLLQGSVVEVGVQLQALEDACRRVLQAR